MIIIDDYIKDDKLLADLAEVNWEKESNKNDYGKVERIYTKMNSKSILEKIIDIFLCDSNFSQYVNEYEKIEYWVNSLCEGDDLDWHEDVDQVLEYTTSTIRHPKLGLVWYGKIQDLEGGKLIIDHEEEKNRKEYVRPVQNRLVAFDVSKRHKISKVLSGQRSALSWSVY